MTAKFYGRADEDATYLNDDVLGSLNECQERESAGAHYGIVGMCIIVTYVMTSSNASDVVSVHVRHKS